MSTLKALSFFLMLCVVKSDETFAIMCKNDYRDMNNNKIDVADYCSRNVCIEKCCGEGEMLNFHHLCENSYTFLNKLSKARHLIPLVNYSNLTLHSWDGISEKTSKKKFVFVKNHRTINCTSEHLPSNEYYILEDGSIRMQDTAASKIWFDIKNLEYCVAHRLMVIDRIPVVKVVVREYNADQEDVEKKTVFVLVGLLISSFFLLLVLVVYSLLPKLRNLIGMVLMAYVLSILVAFVVKIIIQLRNASNTKEFCKVISPLLYFAAVSSFLWLNVMSYDVWWSLRGHRKRYAINRRGEVVKFLWYCLYAWGTPLLITAIVVTLDNINLSNLPHVTKPPFDDCFANEAGVKHYFIIPIGVVIGVNIILFGMTVYNIWMIQRAVDRCQDSRSSKQQTNRFSTYIKLSVIMGVSWCLELIPSEMPFWVFVLTTAYNLFIGVAIFFLFVFEKRIFFMLCNRLNIQNEHIKKWEDRSKSGTTRTSRASTFKSKSQNRDQEQELDILKHCPKGESVDDDAT